VTPLFLADLGWRFVTSDQHNVARQVNEAFSDTRVVGKPDTGELAVAVWVPRDKLGKDEGDDATRQPVANAGGAWCLSFRLRDPATGGIRRTLESDLLEELRRKDNHRRMHKVDPRKMYNELLEAHNRREEARLRHVSDRNRAVVEQVLFEHARRNRIPWNPSRIYVPGS
jgi:hypothetical protein